LPLIIQHRKFIETNVGREFVLNFGQADATNELESDGVLTFGTSRKVLSSQECDFMWEAVLAVSDLINAAVENSFTCPERGLSLPHTSSGRFY
jgi:hypothetical protein